ncbi:MAG TPA: cytochrome c3 family protein [Terriglobales bacterium]|nr:cytochrome c3 family protein [Terriglobales bacterium]
MLPGRVVWFLLGSWLWAGLLAAQRPPETASDLDSAKCVGTETCQTCHEESYQSFADSAHARTLENPRPAERGCEGCHGPGADHVNAGGDPGKIRRFADANPDTIRERCAACHAMREDAHSRARITCLSCHSAHHYREKKFLLIASSDQLCRKCHSR